MDTINDIAPPSSTPAVRQPEDVTCTFCNGTYSDSRPAKLVPGTATVYGHQACINASTIGMKAIGQELLHGRTLTEMLDAAQAALDAYMDAEGPPLVTDLHRCADELIAARAELRRLKSEVLSA